MCSPLDEVVRDSLHEEMTLELILKEEEGVRHAKRQETKVAGTINCWNKDSGVLENSVLKNTHLALIREGYRDHKAPWGIHHIS